MNCHFAKFEEKMLFRKNNSKNLTAGVFFFLIPYGYTFYFRLPCTLQELYEGLDGVGWGGSGIHYSLKI